MDFSKSLFIFLIGSFIVIGLSSPYIGNTISEDELRNMTEKTPGRGISDRTSCTTRKDCCSSGPCCDWKCSAGGCCEGPNKISCMYNYPLPDITTTMTPPPVLCNPPGECCDEQNAGCCRHAAFCENNFCEPLEKPKSAGCGNLGDSCGPSGIKGFRCCRDCTYDIFTATFRCN